MQQRRQRKPETATWTEINRVVIRTRPEQTGLAKNSPPEPPAAQSSQEDARSVGDELQGVYIISVAARILAMHPQTLRKYERLGLISPFRTIGMLRLYSEEDIQTLRLIRHFEENLGLNLAGVEFALTLVKRLLEMRRRLLQVKDSDDLTVQIDDETRDMFRWLGLPLGGDGDAVSEERG